MEIRYVGLNKLDAGEAMTVQEISEKSSAKLEKHTSKFGDASVLMNIKKHTSGGKARYEILLKLSSNMRKGVFKVTHNEWDIARLLHGAFEALGNQIQHEFKQKK